MTAASLAHPLQATSFAELARPEPLPDGTEPEERVVIYGIGWKRHLALDQALGDDRPGPRFYYLNGDLEIMSTSDEHERIKKWIADMMADYFFDNHIEIMPRGQATMRILEKAGAEPDESWLIGEFGQWPDLVLEIALTSGGLPKLAIYREFQVPEVWFWRRGGLEIHTLRADGEGYDRSEKSCVLPGFDSALLERCVAIRSWQEARRAFREGLAK